MTLRNPARYLRRRPLAALLRLQREASGVAAIEFAIIFPLLLLLMVGIYDICAGVVAYRKATIAARSVAAITALTPAVTTGSSDDAFKAAGLVMGGLTDSDKGVFIYKVTATTSCLDWSYSNPAGLQAAATPPDGLIAKGSTGYVILGMVSYRFNPIPDKLFGAFDASMTLTGRAYAIPLDTGSGFTYPSLKKC